MIKLSNNLTIYKDFLLYKSKEREYSMKKQTKIRKDNAYD